MSDHLASLPYAWGGPVGRGVIKQEADDFAVEEILGFEPSGSGEHVFLRIEKTHENTDYVARQIARFAGVPGRDIGYAGLKDRHGRTVQWFSVPLSGKPEPDWSGLENERIRILEITRNSRKLKKGAAAANRFKLTIREFEGDCQAIEARLAEIASQGVPNYFGAQRFGHDGQNLARVREFFAGQSGRIDAHRRGLYLSSARSEIFNRQLAERVQRKDWNQAISGDVFMFSGSRSFFSDQALDDDIRRRVAEGDIHPSGALWGTGESSARDEALLIERSVVESLKDLAEGLEKSGVEMARRPFRLCVESLTWEFPESGMLRLAFTLPGGTFATVILRELLDIGVPEVRAEPEKISSTGENREN